MKLESFGCELVDVDQLSIKVFSTFNEKSLMWLFSECELKTIAKVLLSSGSYRKVYRYGKYYEFTIKSVQYEKDHIVKIELYCRNYITIRFNFSNEKLYGKDRFQTFRRTDSLPEEIRFTDIING